MKVDQNEDEKFHVEGNMTPCKIAKLCKMHALPPLLDFDPDEEGVGEVEQVVKKEGVAKDVVGEMVEETRCRNCDASPCVMHDAYDYTWFLLDLV